MSGRPRRSSWIRVFDEITQLSAADRCLLLCATTWAFLVAFWLLFAWAWRFPERAPYFEVAGASAGLAGQPVLLKFFRGHW
jgi:hypothetical protein